MFFGLYNKAKTLCNRRGICPYMTIKRRKKHGRIYLEEHRSIRINGKVKSIYVKSLGPESPVSNAPKLKPLILDRLEHGFTYRAGDVGILWQIAQELDYVKIIDGICCGNPNIDGPSPGKFLTAWAINRAIDPMSATKLENWIPTTDIPHMMNLSPADFSKDALLSALDFVSYKDIFAGRTVDYTSQIDDELYRTWREKHPLQPGEKELLAYDLTSVLFFGVSCPLAELGYNPDRIKRLQINLALVVSRSEKYPVMHFIYGGSRNSNSTVKNLLTRLCTSSVKSGTMIWDRGNVSKEHIQDIGLAGWKILCGLPKSLKAVKVLLRETDVKCSHETLTRSSKAGHIYSISTMASIYGTKQEVIVYTNRERGVKDSDERNEALAAIQNELMELSEKAYGGERKIHEEAARILNDYLDVRQFVNIWVRRTEEKPRLSWKIVKRALKEAEQMDGKYVLLNTDPELSTKEAVNTYLEKDFIEKVFRTMKTDEDIEPVRHKLESRVKAYVFVCVLAYRLLSVLQYKLKQVSNKDDTWERADTLLQALSRVERTHVKLGHQVKILYLNRTDSLHDILVKLGYSNLFKDRAEVEV